MSRSQSAPPCELLGPALWFVALSLAVGEWTGPPAPRAPRIQLGFRVWPMPWSWGPGQTGEVTPSPRGILYDVCLLLPNPGWSLEQQIFNQSKLLLLRFCLLVQPGDSWSKNTPQLLRCSVPGHRGAKRGSGGGQVGACLLVFGCSVQCWGALAPSRWTEQTGSRQARFVGDERLEACLLGGEGRAGGRAV